jgi:hypothetical protein
MPRMPNAETSGVATFIGCWLLVLLANVGFWGFVLYLAWKLVTHITG